MSAPTVTLGIPFGLSAINPGSRGGGSDVPLFGATIVANPTGVAATDEANIASAVATAGTGGVLLFANGTYSSDSLVPLTGQTWLGAPGHTTIVQRPSGSTLSIITGTGFADFTLSGIVVDGNRSNSTASNNSAVDIINSARTTIINCIFQNTPSNNAALFLRGATDLLVTQCRFDTVGYGVLLGLLLGDSYVCQNNLINDNVFDTSDNDMVFFGENLGSNNSATTIAAGSNGSVLPQATIFAASIAGFPTTGSLRIGGQGGPVVAYTGVTGGATPSFNGCTLTSGAGTLTTGETVNVYVAGLVSACNFVGNTINAPGDCGIEVGSGCVGCNVTGNVFTGSASTNQAILFRDATHSVASGNICRDASKSGGVGINHLNANYFCVDIDISDNNCSDNGFCGILATGTLDLNINGGSCDHNSTDGIKLVSVTGYSISNVNVIANSQIGISVGSFGVSGSGCTDGTINGNRIKNNGSGGTTFDGLTLFENTTGTVISGNRINDTQATKTQRYGINVFDSTVDATISNNDLTGNKTGSLNNTGAATSLRVSNNNGYNPIGITGSTALGASPATYTAGITPEFVYVGGAAGTSITKNGFGVNYSTTSGGVYYLDPGESIIVTYTPTAPTLKADKK